jgi:hypothetical protein
MSGATSTSRGRLALCAAVGAFALAGCAETDQAEVLGEQEGIVRVEAGSEECWSGHVGDSSKDGCGDAEFEVGGKRSQSSSRSSRKRAPATGGSA